MKKQNEIKALREENLKLLISLNLFKKISMGILLFNATGIQWRTIEEVLEIKYPEPRRYLMSELFPNSHALKSKNPKLKKPFKNK